MCWIGIAVFGSLLSWVGSFVLCGFGQLVENSDTLVMRSMRKDAAGTPAAPMDYKCPICGKSVHYGEESCEKCGQKLFWGK